MIHEFGKGWRNTYVKLQTYQYFETLPGETDSIGHYTQGEIPFPKGIIFKVHDDIIAKECSVDVI